MLEFLQAYGVWILLAGAFMFLMMRGGGCGMMGHSQHQGRDRQADDRPPFGADKHTDSAELPSAQSKREDVKPPVETHSGGCH